MNMDLAADATIEALMKYSVSITESVLNENYNPHNLNDIIHFRDKNVEPIMMNFGIYLLGCGNPTWAISKIYRKKEMNMTKKLRGIL